MKKILLSIILFFGLFITNAQTLTVTTDKNPALVGEQILIKFTVNAKAKDFKDSGFSYYLNPQLSFSIFKWLALYGTLDLRYDKLKVQTAAEIQDAFDQVTYLNTSFGVRFKL